MAEQGTKPLVNDGDVSVCSKCCNGSAGESAARV